MAEEQTYEKGLVSIVTPVYKAERFIGDTIQSVQSQTYQQWELLLVDDCSPDRSADIIRPLAAADPRIRYVRLDQNSGAAVARNKALEMARGEYLAFLDADDIWVNDKLERQLRFMAAKQADFVYTAIFPLDEEGYPMRKRPKPVPEKVDYRYLLRHTVIATSSVLLRREAFGAFTMPLRRGGQDYATWLMLLRHTPYAYGQNTGMTYYRVSNHSLSSNKLSSVSQVYSIQREEGINPLSAALNTLGFCIYAFKKHFL